MENSNIRSLSQSTRNIKPQRLAVKPSKSIFIKKENMLKTEQLKLAELDDRMATKKQLSVVDKSQTQGALSKKSLRTKLEPLNPDYVTKSHKLLYDELFVKKLTENNTPPTLLLATDDKKQETPSDQDFDEGLKTLKAVTKKEEYYEIYEIMKNKRGTKSSKDLIVDNAIFGGFSTVNFSQTKEIYQTDNKHRTMFDNMIFMDVPNVITLGKSQSIHHQLNVSTSAPNILTSFQKRDVMLRLKTNALDKEDSHQYQAYLYLGINYENQFHYDKAINVYRKVLTFALETEDKNAISYCYNKLGISHFKAKDYHTALEFHLNSLSYSPPDKRLISLYNIGLAYKFLRDYDSAVDYFGKALQWGIRKNDKNTIVISKMQIGLCFVELDQNDKALELYKESLEIVERYGIQELKMDLLVCLSAVDSLASREAGLDKKTSFKSLKDLDAVEPNIDQSNNEYFKAYKYALSIKNENAQIECKINYGIATGESQFNSFKNGFKL